MPRYVVEWSRYLREIAALSLILKTVFRSLFWFMRNANISLKSLESDVNPDSVCQVNVKARCDCWMWPQKQAMLPTCFEWNRLDIEIFQWLWLPRTLIIIEIQITIISRVIRSLKFVSCVTSSFLYSSLLIWKQQQQPIWKCIQVMCDKQFIEGKYYRQVDMNKLRRVY